MTVIATGSTPKSLLPGVNKWIGMSYNEYNEYTNIFDVRTSTKNFEEIVGTYGTGLAVTKTEGGTITFDTMAQGFTARFTHIVMGLGFRITREAMEDNQYMELAAQRAKALGFSMRVTKETIAANVLNNAFSNSYTMGSNHDGKGLCATDHPLAKGGTYSNRPSVDTDLSELALEQANIDIGGFVNDAGIKIAVRPVKLVIPRQLEFEAKRILGSDLQYDTANNAVNAMKAIGTYSGGYTINHYLTDTNAWFVLTDCPDGMIMFQRRALEVSQDEEFNTENIAFKATERYSFGWADPRGIYGSQGST